MPINKVKNRLAVLVSGNGSNLQSIIDATKSGLIPDASVVTVVSSNKNAYALTRAQNEDIDNYYINRSKFDSSEDFDEEILKILKKYDVKLVILAGYLKILTDVLLKPYEKRILNIHPALLPDFGGVNMYGMNVHRAVIESRRKVSGCTVHMVTEDVDSGPVLAQERVCVLESDTPQILAKRVLEEEHKLYPKIIAEYLKNI